MGSLWRLLTTPPTTRVGHAVNELIPLLIPLVLVAIVTALGLPAAMWAGVAAGTLLGSLIRLWLFKAAPARPRRTQPQKKAEMR